MVEKESLTELTGLIGEMCRYRLVAVVRSKTSEEAVATARAVSEASNRLSVKSFGKHSKRRS